MLKRLFPKVHARYAASANGALLADFAAGLVSAGYARHAAHGHVRRLKQALEWMSSAPFAPDAGISAVFVSQAFASLQAQTRFQGTQRAFERFLAARGQLLKEPDPSRFAPLLDRYRAHLLEVRGLVVSTADQHIATIKRFLAQALSADAPLQDLSALAVEQFVTAEGRRMKRQSLQHVVARLRAFLRFCFERDAVPERLDVIDAPRVYRGELPPRALAWSLVQRLLRSVDRSSRLGWRDYAILHLMAHYGLRPSEIVTLTLGSIDWQAKTLRVKQCKTRSDLILPLAGQTMRMLRRYLYRGRPGGTRPELFLRGRTPAGPLTHYAIGDLYQKRARESGLSLQGTSSYCLRHSFAMRLLDRGVGVKVIGDLLGHRTLESTCVYLRLQTRTLREVALPLPTPVAGIVEGAA
jgi:site-specific recombinase XerD